MLWFFFCIAVLLVGYFVYGKVIEKIFVINPNKNTPAYTMADGVDYVPMSKKKIWLIQLLNIAGTGPIFGPILGALYGPVAMLWIVFGCIFAGAVHDYMCGMLSVRNGGASMPYLTGKYLGAPVKHFINLLAVVLLLLVGVVFVASPAQLMSAITMDVFGSNATGAISVDNAESMAAVAGDVTNTVFGMTKETIIVVWTLIIFAYYIIATLLPIDKIIGRVYPFFGGLLLFMSLGMMYGLVKNELGSADTYFFNSMGGLTTESFFQNLQPKGDLPIWPLLFLTITCGALSGFHATQTPLMARCAENESEGRFIFYGAMIAEGIIALIWCAVGMSFYPDLLSLQDAIAAGSPSKVVYDSSIFYLGAIGGVFAVLGVVILPITSGDTAFRAARLIIAEFFNMEQRTLMKRLLIAVPLFVVGFIVSKVDFQILWRYFSWANQTVAVVMLWTAAGYLYRYRKFHWVCTLPAMFMSAACYTFLAYNKIGFGLDYQLSVYIGLGLTVLTTAAFFLFVKRESIAGDPDALVVEEKITQVGANA
ncbi:carbon starvation protein A [Moraxella caviae]|uniref:Carbon starvation protein A n=2 Tax=Moraxella caviae TaxID=34060 RepID=A0A1S9ZW08_9GAMM|nr:carbon starvation protein A [Moraxella caviae]OOR87161.1 carbon starvation protein A [Moraxella caviae]STZ14945.1 Carbon starvation protein A [Moraxella caviae]VEW12681.1 Carbon starvation protein A [Moraxella caviae]